jgi:hypothetical protein
MSRPIAERFRDDGYAVLPKVVPDLLLAFVARTFDLLLKNGELRFNDGQVERSYSGYGVLPSEALLDMATASISKQIGIPLWPTYTYSRIYVAGARLERHRDRPSCEISGTLTVDYKAERPWPIFVRDRAGRDVELCLERGDLLMYRGTELMHWRDPFEGEYQLQVFLHFVERGGPYDSHKFDKRPHLGAPHPEGERRRGAAL